jgi:hypothetical protein
MLISAVFFFLGFQGPDSMWKIFEGLPGQGGIVDQLLGEAMESVKGALGPDGAAVKKSRDVLNTLDTALGSFQKRLDDLFDGTIGILNDKILAPFKQVLSEYEDENSPEDTDTVVGRIKKLSDSVTGMSAGPCKTLLEDLLDAYDNATEVVQPLKNTVVDIEKAAEPVEDFRSMPKDVVKQINSSLDNVRDYLNDPDKELGLSKKFETLSHQMAAADSVLNTDVQETIDEFGVYWGYVKMAYYTISGLILVMIALFSVSFFTYCCCSRVISSCAACAGPLCCNCICVICGCVGSVICVLFVVFFNLLVTTVDTAIGSAYEAAAGVGSLEIKSVDLGDLTDNVLGTLKPIPIPLAKCEDIHIIQNWLDADAEEAKFLGLFQFDVILPMGDVGTSLAGALRTAVSGAKLPENVRKAIQDTVEEINNSENREQLKKVNATELFGSEAVNQTEFVLDQIDDLCASDQVNRTMWRNYLNRNNAYFNTTVPNTLSAVSRGFEELVSGIRDLERGILQAFKDGFNGSGGRVGLIGALEKLLGDFWDIVDSFSMKPLVHAFKLVQKFAIWGPAHLGTCLSIAAHLLILGQIFIVIELWARRRDQLPGKGGDGDSSGSLSSGKESSSSSSSRTPSGDDADPDESENTIEYESKRPPEQKDAGSDGDSDSEPVQQPTFVF